MVLSDFLVVLAQFLLFLNEHLVGLNEFRWVLGDCLVVSGDFRLLLCIVALMYAGGSEEGRNRYSVIQTPKTGPS